MPDAPSVPGSQVAAFIVYVAAVLTAAMVLFPPFTSLGGTEYAFVLTGPEWARAMEAVGPGFGARLHWSLLLIQIAMVWAIALGARRHFARPGAERL